MPTDVLIPTPPTATQPGPTDDVPHGIGAQPADVSRIVDDLPLATRFRLTAEITPVQRAFLDRHGNLVLSTSLTLGGNLVDGIFEHYPAADMRDGDLFWYNDPYASLGGVTHVPDVVFVMPAFHQGALFAFVETWGHMWDVGGMEPGSISPHATSVFQEGIRMPPTRVVMMKTC